MTGSPWDIFRDLVLTEDECNPFSIPPPGSFGAFLVNKYAPPPELGWVPPYGFDRWQTARWSGKGRGFPTPLGPVPAPMGPALPQEGYYIGPSRLRPRPPVDARWWRAPLIGCDAEATARLWCQHHPGRLHGRYWRPSPGTEYHRRRRARARRRR